MVEIVSQIKMAEEQADEIKKSARQRARIIGEEAVTAGKQKLEAELQQANAQAGGIISEAETQAAAYLEAFAARVEGECEQLTAQSQAKLQKASGYIVERIVERL